MGELTAVLMFVCAMAWMGLGGWAFAYFAQDSDNGPIGGIVIGCLVLAPFVAGAVLFHQRATLRNHEASE